MENQGGQGAQGTQNTQSKNMRILDSVTHTIANGNSYSGPSVTLLLMKCRCGAEFSHPASRWGVSCPKCFRWERLKEVRERHATELAAEAAELKGEAAAR